MRFFHLIIRNTQVAVGDQFTGTNRTGRSDCKYLIPVILSVLIILMAGSAATAAAAEQLNRSQVHDLFSEAKSLFRQAEKAAATDPEAARSFYRQSAMRLERIVSAGGIENGKLFYNIGNAYFRMEDLGRAILNYRRAAQFIPNDPNLKQNFAYARSQRVDRIEDTQKTRMFRMLLFWHYDFSSTTRSVIFAVCYALFWAALLVRIYFRKVPAGLIAGAAFVGILCFGSLAADYLRQERNPGGVLLADEVTARKGDGITYQPSFKDPLHEGTEFLLIEKRNGWYHIRLNDGRKCWIPENTAGME